jgi:hypothetical protein
MRSRFCIFLQRPDRGGGHNPEDEDQLRLRDPEPGRDADLRPQPPPEDGGRLHSALRRHYRYNQRCRPPPSTFTRRRLAATFGPSPPQQVRYNHPHDADLRPQPSPEDGWRLHSALRRHYRYNQRCRPPPSTSTRRRLAATFGPSPPQQVQSEMQTSALNLHQKTAGGCIRPFAATTGTIRDADLRPQPSPEDGWLLHSTIRRYNRYSQRCRPPPSTFTRRRLAATFGPSPPQKVESEMQTSALNLHQKTAGGYIRPFAATTGRIRDADLRPQPSPEDCWRLHSALRRHNR